MTPHKPLSYIKTVRVKGRVYEYFRTGRAVNGREVLTRLPARSDRYSFGQVYAGLVAARHARENLAIVPTMRELSTAYQLTDKYLKRSESTKNTYAVYLRRIEEEMGEAPVNDVARRDVSTLLDKMNRGAASMTLIVLKNMFALALRKEWISASPLTGIELPEGEQEEYEPWPVTLLEEALNDQATRLPVALLYFTAQRISDVCKMRWSDVRDGYLYVRQQKTGKELDIRVHVDLARVLADTPKAALTILHDDAGKPVRPPTLRRRLQQWAQKRGHAVVPHGLRKNAVNALLEADCSVAQTAAISGQSMGMVEHYARRRDNRKLGSAAILKWEGTEVGHGKQEKTL